MCRYAFFFGNIDILQLVFGLTKEVASLSLEVSLYGK